MDDKDAAELHYLRWYYKQMQDEEWLSKKWFQEQYQKEEGRAVPDGY